MRQFNCVSGSSFSDVCLNTYGSMDNYIQLLNDNGLSPEDVPVSSQSVTWNDTQVNNQTTFTSYINNNTIFATLTGYGVPVPIHPIMSTYKDVRQVSYSATSATPETVIAFPVLAGCEIVQIEKEIKPLMDSEYIFNHTTGTITLVGTALYEHQSLFVIYKKKVTI